MAAPHSNPLSREREAELVARAKAGDREAMGELLTAYRRTFLFWTRPFRNLDRDDALQIAYVQAMDAMRDFDPTVTRFITFARMKVMWGLGHANTNTSIVRLPQLSNRRPTMGRLTRLGLSRCRRVISLDGPTKENPDVTLAAIAPDSSPGTAERAERNDEVCRLRRAMGGLGARTRDVLMRRMAGDRLEDIGVDYGVCRERVRQIEADGLRRLREVLSAHAA